MPMGKRTENASAFVDSWSECQWTQLQHPLRSLVANHYPRALPLILLQHDTLPPTSLANTKFRPPQHLHQAISTGRLCTLRRHSRDRTLTLILLRSSLNLVITREHTPRRLVQHKRNLHKVTYGEIQGNLCQHHRHKPNSPKTNTSDQTNLTPLHPTKLNSRKTNTHDSPTPLLPIKPNSLLISSLDPVKLPHLRQTKPSLHSNMVVNNPRRSNTCPKATFLHPHHPDRRHLARSRRSSSLGTTGMTIRIRSNARKTRMIRGLGLMRGNEVAKVEWLWWERRR